MYGYCSEIRLMIQLEIKHSNVRINRFIKNIQLEMFTKAGGIWLKTIVIL